jgi:glycosyltransferase involved in cell wall biosynthesis
MSEKSVVQASPAPCLFRLPRARRSRTIAVITPSYALERVSYMIPQENYSYIKLYRVPLYRLEKWERYGNFFQQTPVLIGPKTDLVHTLNHVPANRRFVVSAEMELPRYMGPVKDWQWRTGFKVLASERCRGIWPLSHAARSFIVRRFEEAGHAGLAGKVTVFRGAVSDAVNPVRLRDSTAQGPLRLLFVGGDGLRKGLRPTLEAAQILRRGGVDLEVTVVGQLEADTYVVPGVRFPTSDIHSMLGTEKWIHHHLALPNLEIRKLMEEHDLFVLPTMDESLGWVLAEAAMSGLPSISTNIFAIPELILDGINGWVIQLPLNKDLRWLHIGQPDAREAWEAAQAQIVSRLTDTIAAISAKRSIIAQFGERARHHVAQDYGMDVAARRLNELYSAAIGYN